MLATTCPSRDTLFRYSVGLISEEQSDELADHLGSCPDCQATILTLADADDTLIRRLRMPLGSESYLSEPQFQAAVANAIARPDWGAVAREASDVEDKLAAMPKTLGEYQLLEELGRGGMGRVYKALQTKLDRVVAVKVLPRDRVGDRQSINRFEREMKAVGRLAHPNIVQAYDAREIDDMPVLIMEFVDGLDLADIVRRVGSVPVAEACELVRRTALALQCAHEHGLVHRDIKPSNIMLTPAGEVKLLDLGLARLYAEGGVPPTSASDEMTGTGQAMGTADYMAPEQASDSRGVDIRADIYSLGCTFYKLLTGRTPFSGPEYRTTLAKMNAHVHQPAPPLRDIAPTVPETLAAIVERMLAKDPAARFATPAEVAAAVAPFCAGADLVALLRRAETTPPVPSEEADSSPPLPPREGRAEGSTMLSKRPKPAPKPVPLPAPRRWKWFAGHLLLLLMVGGLCFALGIIITIKKNGQTYQLEVDDGSRTAIDKHGNVTVDIGQSREGGPAPVIVNPAADLKALQGLWNVVAFEKGNGANVAMEAPMGIGELWADPAFFYRLDFRQAPLWSNGYTPLASYIDPRRCWPDREDGHKAPDLYYRIDPTATPKTMDILSVTFSMTGGEEKLKGLAIYELHEDHLKIAMRGYSPSVMGDQRPKRFAVEPDSDTIVLQLDRYRPAADDKAIQATWDVVKQLDDGKAVSAEKLRGRSYLFANFYVKITDPSRAEDFRKTCGQWVIDSTKQPKTISILTYDLQHSEDEKRLKSLDFHGIYKLEGDRLTIAYRQNGPAPEKFESTRGSGVTLLEFEKAKPGAAVDIVKQWNLQNVQDRVEAFLRQHFPDITRQTTDVFGQKTQEANGDVTFYLKCEVTIRGKGPKTLHLLVTLDSKGEVLSIADMDGSSGGIIRGAPPPPPPTVRVTQPVVCNVCDYEEYTGRIEKGLVKLSVPERFLTWATGGTAVKADDLLAASADVGIEVSQASQSLQNAENESGAAAETKDAKRIAAAEAKVRSARDALDQAMRKHRSEIIVAPISGKLEDETTWVGNSGHVSSLTITSLDSLIVSFDVPERVVLEHRRMTNRKPNWELSLPVVFELADEKGFPHHAKVFSVAKGIDPQTHAQRWQALVPNKDGIFMPGMSVRVRVITSEPHKVTLIPEDSCYDAHQVDREGDAKSGTRWIVNVVNDRNVVEHHEVGPGVKRYDNLISVTKELSAGDWFTVQGYPPELAAGTTVKPEKIITPPLPWALISVPPTVTVVRPIVREVSDSTEFTGHIEAAQTAEIRARASGNLDKVCFKPGMSVKQGDLLFEIDPRLYQAEFGQASSMVKQAKVHLEQQIREVQRFQEAVKNKVITQEQFDQAKTQQADAEAALQTAEAALNVARVRLEYTRIVAPFAGKISRSLLDAGNLVTADKTVLATLASTDPMYVYFDVDERTMLAIRRTGNDRALSLPVSCGLPDEEGFAHRGKMDSADSRIDPATGTVRWRAVLPNKDGILVPGMFVRVRLLTGDPHKALLVPERSLGSDRGRKFVFVVNDQNVAERRDVTAGQLDDGMRVVTEGLEVEDWVITSGLQQVRPGTTVKPEKAAPPVAPPSK